MSEDLRKIGELEVACRQMVSYKVKKRCFGAFLEVPSFTFLSNILTLIKRREKERKARKGPHGKKIIKREKFELNEQRSYSVDNETCIRNNLF